MTLPRCIAIAAALSLSAAQLSGQATPAAASAQPAGAGTASETLDAPAARSISVRGVVRRADGSPAADASVVLAAVGFPSRDTKSTRTNGAGEFTIDSVAPGAYRLSAHEGSDRAQPNFLSLVSSIRHDVLLPPGIGEETRTLPHLLTTLACLLLFVIVMVTARWHHIARSVHAMLVGQLAALTTRLDTEVGECTTPHHQTQLAALRATVTALSAQWKSGTGRPINFMEVLFWSRGRENATWVVIHEIERQLAAFLAPAAQVDAYLRWADAELRTINRASAIVIADAIRESLAQAEPANERDRERREETRKALLGRGISIIYGDRDTSFSSLMEWQNKAGWLILAALIIIAFLTVAAGHGTLFLAGAAGGFLSRLMRALKREDVPLDYGASWTTLFLSPLLGALAGWFGVAIITLAADPRLGLLGDAFRLVRWDHPTAPATFAIAFILGFSERLFDSIVGAVERLTDPSDGSRRGATSDAAVAAATRAPSAPVPGAGAAAAASRSAQAAGDADATPAIVGVDRQRRAEGAPRDALVVRGSGFANGVSVTTNGVDRPVELQSAESLLLPLGEADLMLMDAGADFLIVVTNPGGASSAPFDFA